MPNAARPPQQPTPADDPVLQFLQTVWAMEHALERASKRMEQAIGLSGPQRFALRLIGERPGLTPLELARMLRLHPGTVTGIIQRLESRGFIRRESNPTDRRVSHLHLTATGRRANVPDVEGTIEHAARATLARCSASRRKAAAAVLAHFTRELMTI